MKKIMCRSGLNPAAFTFTFARSILPHLWSREKDRCPDEFLMKTEWIGSCYRNRKGQELQTIVNRIYIL